VGFSEGEKYEYIASNEVTFPTGHCSNLL